MKTIKIEDVGPELYEELRRVMAGTPKMLERSGVQGNEEVWTLREPLEEKEDE